MCGIFGVLVKKDSCYRSDFLKEVVTNIACLSQARGKDSSGLLFMNFDQNKINVFKGAISISKLIKSKELIDFEKSYKPFLPVENGLPFTAIGHARLVTNGSQLQNINNQPVIKEGIIGIHNGIIVNVDDLWLSEDKFKRSYSIDTEILLVLVKKFLEMGCSLAESVSKAMNKIQGTVSSAMIFNDINEAVLTTNNGSLYLLENKKDFIVYASEGYFLKQLSIKRNLTRHIGHHTIRQVQQGSGLIINLENHQSNKFKYDQPFQQSNELKWKERAKIIVTEVEAGKQNEVVLDISKIHLNYMAKSESSILENNHDNIKKLERCTKCLLPETFPFIEYNNVGVCNYCNNYKPKNPPKDISSLLKLVEPYRSKNGNPDCLVPFSGGRDSTFTLHHVKRTLDMNPVAFTYDWGMVTDLARRNIARICGKLGIENIIVSADIHWKRKNIRKNILAWLKQPDLGMIPLFMAGDKYFFYYTEQLKKQMDIDLNIWGINILENTDFKVGFCNVKPNFNKQRIYSLSTPSKIELVKHVSKNLFSNPSYLNSSIWDTIGSFFSRYLIKKRDYYHFFDFYSWNEKEIEELLYNEYNWETAVDTKATWRIGDGTAGFYNYIYYTVAGFSEYDTFRSNQIREGMITREEARLLVENENRPRYESIKWYTEIVGLDFESTIKRINSIPKLYL